MKRLPRLLSRVVPAARGEWSGFAIALGGVVATTALLAPLRDDLGLLNVGLCFLLLVIVVAARWGRGPGIAASLLANLAINFFFVPPLHTLDVAEPHNVLGLAIFLVVAALTSALLSRARAGEAAARRQAEETAILYDLSRLIIVSPNAATTLTSICRRVRETFAVESCSVLLPGEGGLRRVAASGAVEAAPRSAYERHAIEEAFASGAMIHVGGDGPRRPRIVGMRDRRAPVVCVPLTIGARVQGVLQVVGRLEARVFTHDELRLLEAFADEAALAADRDRLLQEAARAEALQEANRLKSALLAAVSHDLRTPLTAILAAVSSLLQSEVAWDEATRQQFLTSIESQTLRLTRLVSNLLDLSRIEGGALRPDTDWYDLAETLSGAVAGSAPSLAAHRVIMDIAPDVGVVPLDQIQFSQVITNLLENAAKFAPPGTAITVSARRDGASVEVAVADEGPGVPPTERENVFEKFYQTVARGGRATGAGLGLAIAKGLVEAHGGRIRVEEAPRGGARFVVSLPAPRPGRIPAAVEDRR